MILIIYILLTILLATADALFFNGEKASSKLIECFFQIGIFLVPLFYKRNFDFMYLFGCGLVYLFLRLALFDLTFNIITGLGVNFVGTTSHIYDNIMSNFSDIAIWINRVFFLGLALLIYFKKIHNNQ
jgi:hypothetical protein